MKLFYWINEDKITITVHAQAESEDSDIGCCFDLVKPGESVFGVTYEQFIADDTGEIDVP